ncbi:MAG: hypothetical protein FJZ43_04395 [Candidatus Staskawiczbacteria bacterium]|nr:hypothetical protein [Candidatus Staskawiczbacteria bacterium]
MGRQARIKKYRNQIVKKLEESGLKNELKKVPTGKTAPMVKFETDEKGNQIFDELNNPKYSLVMVEQTRLSNPFKSTLRRLLREEEAVIKQFLKQ